MTDTERPASPTPSERNRKDAEDRKREEEEQSKLPYKWTQTLTEAEILVPVDAKYKGRDLVVEITKTHLKVQIKGQQPIIDVSDLGLCTTSWLTEQGDMPHAVKQDDCTWTLEDNFEATGQRDLYTACKVCWFQLVGTHCHISASNRHYKDST